ncbi:hypothetical protein SmJEL517_g05787 [Synchytrium microbalum]|uniref:Response regulatory domain-containing protein n=1 Tax=Synchytrium microbalum TaxID=1806994 RepID=A0A507BLZ2_9FUNG|nr:uncharacterized protein SmJEL517_g05787 [Synchytrium microbalum]TPX30697.1 hypothetical protein SmJEL517_g05787 [Synchytrium microbalum]
MVCGELNLVAAAANCSILLVWLSIPAQWDREPIVVYSTPPARRISVPTTIGSGNTTENLYSVERLRAELILDGQFNDMKLFQDSVHNFRHHFVMHTPQKQQGIVKAVNANKLLVSQSQTRRYGGTAPGLGISNTPCQYMGHSINACPYLTERRTHFDFVIHLNEYRPAKWETRVAVLPALPERKCKNTIIGIVDSNPNSQYGLKQLAWHCSSSLQARSCTTLQELLHARIPLHGISMPADPSTCNVNLLKCLIAVYRSRIQLLNGFVPHKPRGPNPATTLPVSKRALLTRRLLKSSQPARFVEDICSVPVTVSTVSSQPKSPAPSTSIAPLPLPTPTNKSPIPPLAPIRALSSSSMPNTTIPPLRILVVEDNTINQLVITKMLTRLGQRIPDITIANDGAEGYEMIQANPNKYEVVLMDITMPRMDGYECTLAIRSRCMDGVAPWIIGLTANAFWEDRVRCHRVGMQDFVSKPATLEDLKQALQRYVDQRNL